MEQRRKKAREKKKIERFNKQRKNEEIVLRQRTRVVSSRHKPSRFAKNSNTKRTERGRKNNRKKVGKTIGAAINNSNRSTHCTVVDIKPVQSQSVETELLETKVGQREKIEATSAHESVVRE